jgi:hypothetical protein
VAEGVIEDERSLRRSTKGYCQYTSMSIARQQQGITLVMLADRQQTNLDMARLTGAGLQNAGIERW